MAPVKSKRIVRERPCACDVCDRAAMLPARYCDACLASCTVTLGDGRYPLKRWARIIAHMTPEQRSAALDAAGKLLEAGGQLLRRIASSPAVRGLKGPPK